METLRARQLALGSDTKVVTNENEQVHKEIYNKSHNSGV